MKQIIKIQQTILMTMLCYVTLSSSSSAQIVSTIAGTGASGSTDGPGVSATFNYPYGPVIDATGNIYVPDNANNKIRKITPTGVVSTYAGTGIRNNINGQVSSASFNQPFGIAFDAGGNLYVADCFNHVIRKITTDGIVSTYAGTGTSGSSDGPATSASFNQPYGIAIDPIGNLYVADHNNAKIRKISPAGVVSTFAGTGTVGSTDGPGTSATFNDLVSIAIDANGNLYVADRSNNKIRKINPSGSVSSFGTGTAGSTDGPASSASFNWPNGVAVDVLGNVYVADRSNNKIRKISTSGMVSTIAGTGTLADDDGPISTATFSAPTGLGLDASGNIYIAEAPYNKIRKITFCISPSITTQPASQSVCVGNQISFSIAGSGDGLTYQWRKETNNISGATSSTLILNNLSSTDAANYSCVVTGTCGTITSNTASLTVQTTVAPTTSAQLFCANQQTPTVGLLTASGTAIKWYSASSGGSPLVSNEVLNTGTYYASQTVNGCEGPRASASVTVQSTTIPTAVAQTFCASQNPTVANLVATGTAIKWYTGATGGLSLPAIAPLSTATYYASQTVNGCESNRIPVNVIINNTAYTLNNVDAVCSSSFLVPLQTIGTIKNGLVGLDFTLNYDQTLVTPTGTASPGAVATAYGDYSLNISTPGQVVVSVYLKNAPSNTFFSGAGTIISVNFNVKAGVAINSTGTLSTGLIEESTVIGASTNCNATSSTLKIVGVVGGKIIYRDDMTNDLGYDASSPSSYTPTVITGYGSNCSTQVGVPVMPNTTGIFGYYPGNGSTLKIERDVKGDFNLPPLQCTNVQSVINSADYQLALTIANSSYTTPSLYELMSADVNQDGKVTAGDVSLISSRSINQYNCEFPQAWNYEWNGTAYVPKSTYSKSKDWLFVPDVYATSPSFVLNMGRNKVPQLPACLPNPPGTASCTANANTIYHALLLGDVNANWTKAANGGQTRESSSYEIVLDLLNAIDNGSSKTIPVYYNGAASFTGIDFSLDYTAGITISGITAGEGVSLQWNNIGGQRLMVAAYADQELRGKYPVLYLTVATEDILTADQFTATAGYLNGEKASLRFDGNTTSGNNEDFYVEVFPNPSNAITYLYTTDASAFVKVNIYTGNGFLVYENATVPANENVTLPELKPGIYVLKVSGSNGETTKKLVKY